MIVDFFRKRARFFRLMWSLGGQSFTYSLKNHHPFKSPVARALSDPENKNLWPFTDKSRRLIDHYVQQFNEAACSVATAQTVLNAMFASDVYTGPIKHVTQENILDQVDAVDWKERITPSLHKSKRGLPVRELGMALQASLEHYAIPFTNVETIPFDTPGADVQDLKETLLEKFYQFETDDRIFMVAHFNQGIFLRGMHIPHISPIGAFNTKNRDVLVLDVDKAGPGPYWVSFEEFFTALLNDYNGKLSHFGYSGGGYVVIQTGD